MLPFLSSLIEQSAGNAFARPHQLLLTGDQIYADDVGFAMSMLLTDATEALLGWDEEIICNVPGTGSRRKLTEMNPGLRGHIVVHDAGFTSEDFYGQLIGLGEYIAMYLFVWSDVLWPAAPDTLPTFNEIMAFFSARFDSVDAEVLHSEIFRLSEANRDGVTAEIARTADFGRTVKDVRRALANIPSYMIFDDHEITDDWNMTRNFCKSVYGSELGLRIVQNGLVAYALCQHWGNVPKDFPSSESTAPAVALHPGASLLALIDTPQPMAANAFQQKAARYDAVSKDIRKLLGVHDAAAVRARADHAVFHDSDSLRYHFTVEGPSHQVIFTDTRTWRSFPAKIGGTHLLTRNAETDQFKEQILDAPDTGHRLLFVVLTTNAPPVQPIRAATRHDRLTNFIEFNPDVYEAWELPTVAFDRLLVALTSKLPLDASNQHVGAIILLSGDVHHSFATRTMYRAAKRYEDDDQPRGATAVIAQLVASSLKKQTDSTVRFQREGYYAAPKPWISQRMIRHTLTEAYVGWNFGTGSQQKVGTTGDFPDRIDIGIDKRGTVDVSRAEPLFGPHDARKVDLTQRPHYRYRCDYLMPTAQTVQTPPPSIPPLPAGSSLEERKNAARAFAKKIAAYRVYNVVNPPTVVGVNNFGEIKLDWGTAASRKVHHILRWWDSKFSQLKLTTYSVRLDLNSPTDLEFPDIKARVEPP